MAEDIISIMDIYKATFNPHLQWFERLLNSPFEAAHCPISASHCC